LSTIPCIAHCLLGCYAGKLIFSINDLWQVVNRLFIMGTIILLAGFLLDYAFPINKSLWSASYVLLTCGLASLLLALLIWIIDVCHKGEWLMPFESFGVNPLFIFVLSGLLAIIMANIRFTVGGETYSVWGYYYKQIMLPVFGENGGSLVCALIYDALMWCIAYPLYRKKIYIKI
jgi:predicted acyltransferase